MNPYPKYYLANVPTRLRDRVLELCCRSQCSEAHELLLKSGFSEYGLSDLQSFYDLAPTRLPAVYPVPSPVSPPPQPASPAPTPEPVPQSAAAPAASTALAPRPRPKQPSKLAALPKQIRDQVNSMLDEDVSYANIVQWLAEHGFPGFNRQNIYLWARGPYKDWKFETERLANQALQRKWLLDLTTKSNPEDFFPLIDQLIITQLLDGLFGLDTVTLKEGLANNPRHFVALLNAYRRLKRDGLSNPVKPCQT